jgi:hypothetical protein
VSGMGDAFDPSRVTLAIFAGPSGKPAEKGRNKNFWSLRGRPVVQRQLDLAKGMGFGRIVLITETSRLSELELPPGTIVLESAARQSENFANVKKSMEWGPNDRCLVTFGDTPLLSQGAILDFLERCRRNEADVHHGLVPYVFVEPFMDFFPRDHFGRRPFHVKEFRARLGCLSLARVASFDPEETRRSVQAVMAGRKQDPGPGRAGFASVLLARWRVLWGGLRFVGPMGLWMSLGAVTAHWLHERGFPVAARFFRRAVTLERLDEVFGKLLGCKARMVPCPFGGTSLDLDNEVDLLVHEQYYDHMLALQALQDRVARKLVEPGFELSWEALAALDRFDPELAAELRRHPETYRRQQKILLMFPLHGIHARAA